ncbi:hypothetical protein CDL12_21408 [Handroanthus impetiginosus]|uniref:Uncharacterized protein n=1 Tax=Handroanthus impetiginosus TaxID=429701 RepID=A0A2G9GLA2_9LAMI|nr:hypothetical protein CDL12_21408 [Handroanthus impetiginosus]
MPLSMAFSSTRVLILPLPPPSSFPFRPCATSFPKLLFRPPKNPYFILSSASSSNNQPPSPFTSEQAVLEAVADFDADEKSLPAVRTYENDLARLTLVGAVDFQQALTAAAADGGEAADEHISSGTAAMVVETIFPGPADDHSTVSTRLFLPARKVKEKAKRLKKSLTKDMLHGVSSKNILAMTFRQVVLQQLWSLELALFRPGTQRNMDNLENPREVPVLLTLSSSDERIISEIGEVVCLAAFENTERHFVHDSTYRASDRFFSWFNKRKQISSRDSSVVLYNFLEHEMLANVGMLLEKFNLERGKNELKGTKLRNSLWKSPTFSKLERIGGPEFCAWISECVPSYMLEIDANKHGDMKFEGWKKSEENRWGVVLTHSQVVNLADILDMYYEDVFTMPSKRLSCSAVAKPSNLNLNKGSSLLNRLLIVLVSGIFLVALSVLGKLYLPFLPFKKNYIQENFKAPSSDISCVPIHSLEVSELDMCCVSIIRRIKDSYGWPGEIRENSGVCASIGELPKFLKIMDDTDSNMPDISSTSIALGGSEDEMKQLEDIASYQVVVSTDGKIVGFQPTNRVAVNNWAANPLAKELYGGKNLSPGLLEPGLKIIPPNGVVVLELLMSLNPNSYFAVVRPVDVNGNS